MAVGRDGYTTEDLNMFSISAVLACCMKTRTSGSGCVNRTFASEEKAAAKENICAAPR